MGGRWEGEGLRWLCDWGVRRVGCGLGGLFEMGNTYALGFGGSSGGCWYVCSTYSHVEIQLVACIKETGFGWHGSIL